MNKLEERFINKRFGKLTVLKFAEYRYDSTLSSGKIKRAAYYLCKCDCGVEKILKGKYLKNKDTKSCGCLIIENVVNRNIENKKEDACLRSVYSRYKGRSKYKSIDFKISISEFKIITLKNCYYCGVPPLQLASNGRKPRKGFTGNKNEYYYNGIDRIDSSLGYTENNIRPCCEICNKAKRDLSDIDFKKWIDRLVKFQNDK